MGIFPKRELSYEARPDPVLLSSNARPDPVLFSYSEIAANGDGRTLTRRGSRLRPTPCLYVQTLLASARRLTEKRSQSRTIPALADRPAGPPGARHPRFRRGAAPQSLAGRGGATPFAAGRRNGPVSGRAGADGAGTRRSSRPRKWSKKFIFHRSPTAACKRSRSSPALRSC